MPTNAADAAGLLASAIADPNPVVFVENKALYFRREARARTAPEPLPLGRAHRLRAGPRRDDRRALAAGRRGDGRGRAAGRRGDRGRGDRSAHAGAARPRADRRVGAAHRPRGRRPRGGPHRRLRRRAGRRSCRPRRSTTCDAPIQRVGAPFTPVPLSPPLEDAYRPGSDEIYAAARHARRWRLGRGRR